jgi:hypothetical protein
VLKSSNALFLNLILNLLRFCSGGFNIYTEGSDQSKEA